MMIYGEKSRCYSNAAIEMLNTTLDWIVMEYCGGGSIADLIGVTKEPLDEPQIAYFCREVLKGLSYLHTIFKVYRDIESGNILLTEQGQVKLGNFGAADENHVKVQHDVWALGFSAIEMAEGMPPRSTLHPMRVIFMISSELAQMLEDKEKW